MLIVQAEELIAAPDGEFMLSAVPGQMPAIIWREQKIADFMAGASLLAPEIRVDKAIVGLGQDLANRVTVRLGTWMKAQLERHLAPLVAITDQSSLPETPAVVRALFIQLADAGGIIARADLDDALNLLDKDQRQIVRKAGFTIGVLDIYHNALLKPGAAMWRLALMAIKRNKPMLPLPQAGAVLLTLKEREEQMGAQRAGYRSFGDMQLRVDMVERVARGGHEAIAKNERYDATSPFIVSLGLGEPLFNHVMRNSGFRPIAPRSAVEAAASGEEQTVPDRQAEIDAAAGDPESPEPLQAPPPTELPPITPPQNNPGSTPEETPVVPDNPAPVETPDETPPLTPEETPVIDPTPDPGSVPMAVEAEAVPQGANWAFRGRYKPRERVASGSRNRPQNGRDARSTRDGGEKHAGKGPQRQAVQRGTERSVRSPGARPPRRESDRPAGGGAFAGLAALLGREE
jgi:ATP-dependent RNA helicase SUPV3L1/SUV3